MARAAQKPKVLFFDDKQDWRDNFQRQHGDEYDIVAVGSGRDFDHQLKQMIETNSLPDIVLIDLYHPKYPDDSARQERLTAAGEAAIVALEESIRKVRGPILSAWDPYGMSVLERTRALLNSEGHGHIPLVIYTQQGLTIATNEELKRVSGLRGEWLIKNRANAEYESHRIDEIIALHRRDNYRRVYRNTSWTIAAVLIASLLGVSYFNHKAVDLLISLGVSAALVALQPLIAKVSE